MMLVSWEERVHICQIIKSEFYIEIEKKGDNFEGKYWLISIFASSNEHIL